MKEFELKLIKKASSEKLIEWGLAHQNAAVCAGREPRQDRPRVERQRERVRIVTNELVSRNIIFSREYEVVCGPDYQFSYVTKTK